jgi:hypothetical protein
MQALVLGIIEGASALITHIFKLIDEGKKDEAEAVVKRFKALTDEELKADKEAAEKILDERFPKDDS